MFLKVIEAGYDATVPYHYGVHAADVLASSYRVLRHNYGKFTIDFRPIEMLAFVVAAAGHDHGHPGVNNGLLVKTSHQIAIDHNDASVLENHHAASTFHILRHPQLNFMQGVSGKEYRLFRAQTIELILATDMAQHSKHVAVFNEVLAEGNAGRHHFHQPQYRMAVRRVALKLADLGHAFKPPALHRRWSFRIMEEMYRQGDRERNEGLDVVPVFDRELLPGAAKHQVGFLAAVVLPLAQTWGKLSCWSFPAD